MRHSPSRIKHQDALDGVPTGNKIRVCRQHQSWSDWWKMEIKEYDYGSRSLTFHDERPIVAQLMSQFFQYLYRFLRSICGPLFCTIAPLTRPFIVRTTPWISDDDEPPSLDFLRPEDRIRMIIDNSFCVTKPRVFRSALVERCHMDVEEAIDSGLRDLLVPKKICVENVLWWSFSVCGFLKVRWIGRTIIFHDSL